MLVIRNNDVFPHIALRLLVRRRDFARCSGGGNDRWIDLLILIPCWLGVFGVIATILAEVVG
jgi:hypothetical protein